MKSTIFERLTALARLGLIGGPVRGSKRNGASLAWTRTSLALVERFAADDTVDFCQLLLECQLDVRCVQCGRFDKGKSVLAGEGLGVFGGLEKSTVSDATISKSLNVYIPPPSGAANQTCYHRA